MSDTELNSNKALKEQVEINLQKYFSGATIIPIRKVLQKRNTRVISIMMFYETEITRNSRF